MLNLNIIFAKYLFMIKLGVIIGVTLGMTALIVSVGFLLAQKYGK